MNAFFASSTQHCGCLNFNPNFTISPFLAEARLRAERAKEKARLLASQSRLHSAAHKLLRAHSFKERAFHRLSSKVINSRHDLLMAIHEEAHRPLSPREKLNEAIFLEALTAPKWMSHELGERVLLRGVVSI